MTLRQQAKAHEVTKAVEQYLKAIGVDIELQSAQTVVKAVVDKLDEEVRGYLW